MKKKELEVLRHAVESNLLTRFAHKMKNIGTKNGQPKEVALFERLRIIQCSQMVGSTSIKEATKEYVKINDELCALNIRDDAGAFVSVRFDIVPWDFPR